MFAKLELKLTGECEISYQMASAFHGALMELLPQEYGAQLHESRLHPYTQHLERRPDGWYWIVTALEDKAADLILQKALFPLGELLIRQHDAGFVIEKKNYFELSEKELARAFYEGENNRYISLRFLTPTAFKQNGRYLNYPDIRCLFGNLMNKYDACMPGESMKDEDTLEALVQNTAVSRYQLRSTAFSLEGIRIPAFIGEMTLRIGGTQTMANFANMLMQFGTYSGIGIKTALGMGAIELASNDRKFAKTEKGIYGR